MLPLMGTPNHTPIIPRALPDLLWFIVALYTIFVRACYVLLLFQPLSFLLHSKTTDHRSRTSIYVGSHIGITTLCTEATSSAFHMCMESRKIKILCGCVGSRYYRCYHISQYFESMHQDFPVGDICQRRSFYFSAFHIRVVASLGMEEGTV